MDSEYFNPMTPSAVSEKSESALLDRLSPNDKLRIGRLLYSVENQHCPETDEDAINTFYTSDWEVSEIKQNNNETNTQHN